MKKFTNFFVVAILATALMTSCGGDPPPPVSIELDPTTLSLSIGQSQTLTVTVVPADAAVTWTSSDASVASVANGIVTANAEGTATITATAGNQTATCVVTVIDPLTYDPGVVINGVTWATRNVDSHGTFVANPEDFGGYYQWGRRGDGHEQIDSDTTHTLSLTDVPAHGDFIVSTIVPNDWRSTKNDNLWASIKTANDPCPNGWRVPTIEELQSLVDAGSIYKTQNGVEGRIFGSGNDTIFLPVAGWREGMSSLYRSTIGSYWSCTPYGNYVCAMEFGNVGVGTTQGIGGFIRSDGYSVRCVKQ